MTAVVDQYSASPGVAAAEGEKPYRGLDSFQIEDARVFFGRDREADQLIAKILSSRLTVLHAQSGAGKTSVLNARVIPGLEARGWAAVRVIPQNDPIRAIQVTTLLQMLPPPDAERLALERAWNDLDAPDTLGELLARFDALSQAEPKRRRLIAPVYLRHRFPWNETDDEEVVVRPWFCRLLRATLDLGAFSDSIAATASMAGLPVSMPPVDGDTSLSELFQRLTELVPPYYSSLPQLYTGDRDLRPFLSTILERRQVDRSKSVGMVIIFDQAEELFTRFVHGSAGSGQGPNWKLKWEFFEQLEQLLAPLAGESAQGAARLRLVISLRSEYLGHLDPVRSFACEIENSTYHLGVLSKAQAAVAIEEPAKLFGYAYTKACRTMILDQLAREDRFIEPSHLQIVCEWLWERHGKQVADATRKEDFPELNVPIAAGGILRSYFFDYVAGLSHEDRLQTLEMLELLVTRSGTRNILNRDDLVNVRFRDEARRRQLLTQLVELRIVREEGRLGGRFVEITHEFLVDPILAALKELVQNVDYTRFRAALEAVAQIAAEEADPRTVGALRLPQFLALHDNRERIVMNDWLRELMLRSALSLMHTMPEHRSDTVPFWIDQLRGVTTDRPDAESVARRIVDEHTALSREELAALTETPPVPLSAVQLRAILHGQLLLAEDAERESIVYWVQRAMCDDA
jgi:hypothetical protein